MIHSFGFASYMSGLQLVVFFLTSHFLSACQLVSRNQFEKPATEVEDPDRQKILTMVDREILPVLASAREALWIFDSVRSSSGTDRSLADTIYDLEKILRSSALPKVVGENNRSSGEYIELELPFVIDRKSAKLYTKITRERDAGRPTFDVFTIIPGDNPEDRGRMPLFSRTFNPKLVNLSTFWTFDVDQLNELIKMLETNNLERIDPELNLEFTTREGQVEVALWSDTYRGSILGVPWKSFNATVDTTKKTGTRTTINLLCKDRNVSVDLETGPGSLNDSFREVARKTLRDKIGSQCL
jgi:hypothetical protein